MAATSTKTIKVTIIIKQRKLEIQGTHTLKSPFSLTFSFGKIKNI